MITNRKMIRGGRGSNMRKRNRNLYLRIKNRRLVENLLQSNDLHIKYYIIIGRYRNRGWEGRYNKIDWE